MTRPPLAVWWAAALAAGPAAVVWPLLTHDGPPSPAGVGATAVLGGFAAVGLLHGRSWGLWLGWLVVLVYAGTAAGWGWNVWTGWWGWRWPAVWVTILPAAGFAVTLAALLRWPETRRWCGFLAPDPGDDA